MTKLYPVFFMQYGEWYCTTPFLTEKRAQKHIEDRLTTKTIDVNGTKVVTQNCDHMEHAQIVEVQVETTRD